MDRNMQEKLKNFDAVWKRVSAAKCPKKTAAELGLKMKPQQCRNKGKGRYCF